jgi:hypothetical protein
MSEYNMEDNEKYIPHESRVPLKNKPNFFAPVAPAFSNVDEYGNFLHLRKPLLPPCECRRWV